MSDQTLAMRIVRLTSTGQITIPEEFRRELGITDETMLAISLFHGELRLAPIMATDAHHGSPWLRQLYDQLAPVRAETGQ